jgi:hypothetical protein
MAATRTRGRLADPLPEAKPRSDAYTGLLAVSLIGMIAGCIFLYLDYDTYKDKPPAVPAKTASAAVPQGGQPPGGSVGGAPQQGPGAPGGGVSGVPPVGGAAGTNTK